MKRIILPSRNVQAHETNQGGAAACFTHRLRVDRGLIPPSLLANESLEIVLWRNDAGRRIVPQFAARVVEGFSVHANLYLRWGGGSSNLVGIPRGAGIYPRRGTLQDYAGVPWALGIAAGLEDGDENPLTYPDVMFLDGFAQGVPVWRAVREDGLMNVQANSLGQWELELDTGEGLHMWTGTPGSGVLTHPAAEDVVWADTADAGGEVDFEDAFFPNFGLMGAAGSDVRLVLDGTPKELTSGILDIFVELRDLP